MEIRKSALDDPQYAAFAWARFRMMLKWMTLVSFAASLAGVWVMQRAVGEIDLTLKLLTFGGVFAAVMLMAALMGLVFLSNGSGHDEAILNPFEEDA